MFLIIKEFSLPQLPQLFIYSFTALLEHPSGQIVTERCSILITENLFVPVTSSPFCRNNTCDRIWDSFLKVVLEVLH